MAWGRRSYQKVIRIDAAWVRAILAKSSEGENTLYGLLVRKEERRDKITSSLGRESAPPGGKRGGVIIIK